jgi:catechol 2,3-dioxygenase-like lactoylglutathione lyase family enzyme
METTVNFSIDVPDLDAGLRFYRKVFGFREVARPFPAMAVLDAGNVTLCMHQKVAGTRATPAEGSSRDYGRHWTPVHLDIHVPSLDPVLDVIREEGGYIEKEFRTEGPKPVAFCSDPFGHGFCVIAAGGDRPKTSIRDRETRVGSSEI